MNEAINPIIILTGPTATGKSSIALEWARKFPEIEIINADSLLVYRYLNIGTAKPSTQELQEVRHHLVDIRDPNEVFTAGEFLRAAEQAISDILKRGKKPLIVGGTGFYLQSLLFGIWDAPAADQETRQRLEEYDLLALYSKLSEKDPASAQRIGQSDRYRLIRALELIELSGQTPTELQSQTRKDPDPRFRLWILDRDSEDLNERIKKRTQLMLEDRWLDEVQSLRSQFPACRPLQSVGYAQVIQYLDGEKPQGRKIPDGMKGLQAEVELATRQLVKKQRTWFKNQSKKVPQTRWFQLEKDRSLLETSFIKEIEWNHSPHPHDAS